MMGYDTSVEAIINTYHCIVKVMDQNANKSFKEKQRSYGGELRSVKGKLQEYITHSLVLIAWMELGGDDNRIKINSKKISIPIQKDYLEKVDNEKVRKHIRSSISDYCYKLSVDKHVFIDNQFVMAIECKSYTENAMIKRILVDFDLLLSQYPKLFCYLIQLESQMGGDYSKLNQDIYGSKPTHTIMSYFQCKLNIITLLEGERNINFPIHKSFKELKKEALLFAKNKIKEDLKEFI